MHYNSTDYYDDKVQKERKYIERMWSLYNNNKKKTWVPFVVCPICALIISCIIDINSVLTGFILSVFIWVPIACIWCLTRVKFNDDLRDRYGINTIEMKTKAKVNEGLLLGVAISYTKYGIKLLKDSTKPHDKEV